MIEISYTLHHSGGTRKKKRESDQVPRVGEIVTFGLGDYYQVVDVLWDTGNNDGDSVDGATVTACELEADDWEAHVSRAIDDWERARR